MCSTSNHSPTISDSENPKPLPPYSVRIRKDICSHTQNLALGKGAIVRLKDATDPMIRFVTHSFLDDPLCLEGDIGKLLAQSVSIALRKERTEQSFQKALEKI